jgi:threonine aldolase
MDRRHFLAASGLTAATPLLASARPLAASPEAPSPEPVPKPSELINFSSDGLGLSPAEYAANLQQMAATDMRADNYALGGAIAEVEQTFARLLGKPAAMFVATGTLANLIAIRTLAGSDRRVLVQAESHLYNDSGDGASTLGGLNLIPLGAGHTGFDLAEVKRWVARSAGGRVPARVGVISIESPVRRRDHQMVDMHEMEKICRYARAQGIRLHLDGARLFNLPLHGGRSVRDIAALFDTVYVSLWKHFNGASGAVLAGSAEFIDGLFHTRRMFGGSLSQAWPQIALVSQYADRYEAEYAQSWQVMDQMIEILRPESRIRFRKLEHGTSRLFMQVDGIDRDTYAQRASRRGLRLAYAQPEGNEFVLQVNPTLLRRPAADIAKALVASLDE